MFPFSKAMALEQFTSFSRWFDARRTTQEKVENSAVNTVGESVDSWDLCRPLLVHLFGEEEVDNYEDWLRQSLTDTLAKTQKKTTIF